MAGLEDNPALPLSSRSAVQMEDNFSLLLLPSILIAFLATNPLFLLAIRLPGPSG